jgi:Family of unknown function (DUF6508)
LQSYGQPQEKKPSPAITHPMKSRLPTTHEFDELLSFLPRLYAPGFNVVKQWQGGDRDSEGRIHMPYPEYDDVVVEFFRVAGSDCWMDFDYIPEEAYRMLKDNDVIASADLPGIKTMLTFCVRGERFSDGHWESMIEDGYIRRLLERLAKLQQKNT